MATTHRLKFTLLLCCASVGAQDLPRHAVIGLEVATSDNAVIVKYVVEGSAAQQAGFQPGDFIRNIDGTPVSSPTQFSDAIARHVAGDAVRVAVTRGEKRIDLAATLRPRPFETSPGSEVLYRSVVVRDSRRRVIVTKPARPGLFPAVLLMQGLGCDSVDLLDSKTGYGAVLSAFEAHGMVTMRVEKTGVGDSEGPACTDLKATPELEAEGYVAGLRALKSYDFVDSKKVFVFAHSMGPVVGSLAIAQEPVRAFIAVETVGTSWFEYDLERSRVQHSLREPPDEVDRNLKDYEVCSHRFYIEKVPPEELAKVPHCEGMTAPFGPVPYTYMQAVADISLGKQWKDAAFPVLVVYGTASPVTTAHQSHALADLINRFHPGNATYVEVPGMGHDFGRYETQLDYLSRSGGPPHPFHTGLMDVVMGWIDSATAR